MPDIAAAPAPLETPERQPVFPLINQAIVVAALAVVALLGIAGIRALALRVTQYQVAVYETYTREALAQGNWAKAVEVTTGALKSSVNRSDHWGRAWLLRATAEVKLEKYEDALNDVELSDNFFQERYYFAKENDRAELAATATELGKRLLAGGKGEEALRAFGAGATGSGQGLKFLQVLRESLSDEDRALLWPDGVPRLVLRHFRNDPVVALDMITADQGREVLATGSDVTQGEAAAFVEVSPATKEGRTVCAAKVWMPLTNEPCALRLVANAVDGNLPDAFLGIWFDSARQSMHFNSADWQAQGDGWFYCTIPNDFMQRIAEESKARGFSPHDGVLNYAGFEFKPDSANKVRLARVELLLP